MATPRVRAAIFLEPGFLEEAYPDGAPKEIVEKYLEVLENYPDFEPTPSSKQLRHAMLEAVVRSGHSALAYNLSLAARIDPFPDAAANDLVGHLRDINIEQPRELAVAQQLVDLLLETPSTRTGALQMLRIWILTERFPEITARVKQRVTPEELKYLNDEG